MNRFLLLLFALALPLDAARAAPSPDLKTGLKLLRSGTSRNLERGAKLVHMAAVEGETQAEYVTGWLYMKGRGTSRSPKRAVQWFRRAAGKGHLKSQLALGRLLGRSKKEKLRKEAWKWLEAAHAQGAKAAKFLLSDLAKGRVSDALMKKTEKAVTPAGMKSRRSRSSAAAPAAEAVTIDMGRGKPATDAELAAIRKRDEARYAEQANKQKQWADQAAAQDAQADKAEEARKKAEQEAAAARRREAVDRAARKAAGLPELPRGQLSPHLRKKKK